MIVVAMRFVAIEDGDVIFAVLFRQAPVLRQRRKLRTAKAGGNIYSGKPLRGKPEKGDAG